ncbi:hypothetical protein [Brumimicrobium aurantiacum]|uniref:DUF4352 domain-containing protein n=1 Tax=Brumimicrobium aurantiacum TaxID=1737063 RepID=A0A3E1EUF7_9FLAO|nr:hypothetical protein [Brumimicrobium aurantiacum]RFC53206.1 hypothetical protein DXU93_14155 [Brumimicrobium aurantiacum]
MNKLLTLSIMILFSLGLNAQQPVISDTDGKLQYEAIVKDKKDKKNDVFFKFYEVKVKNISNETVTFTPVLNYINNNGQAVNSSNHDGVKPITLAPGESIGGHQENTPGLYLFKEFMVGNSGKKASDASNSLKSITINY